MSTSAENTHACSARLKDSRIVFVLGSGELGGAERQAALFARFLYLDVGAHVSVACLREPSGAVTRVLARDGIPCFHIPADLADARHVNVLWQTVRFALAMKRAHPTVLLPYTDAPNRLCGLTWRSVGARTCVWGQRDQGSGPLCGRMARWAARRTPWFVSNSRGGSQFLSNALGVATNRIRVVPNGVEINKPRKTRDDCRRKWQIEHRRFVACMVANLHELKDHETLLNAWRIVLDSMNATLAEPPLLLLAGRRDKCAGDLESLAVRLELGQSVRFLGTVEDVPALLNAVDVGILSSRQEGLSNAVLEYMAAALPVVGTDIQGIRDAVGATGQPWLSHPGCAEPMAGNIVRLCRDPDLRLKVGRQLQERATAEFSLSAMCHRMTDAVSSFLSSGAEVIREEHYR